MQVVQALMQFTAPAVQQLLQQPSYGDSKTRVQVVCELTTLFELLYSVYGEPEC